MVSVRCNWYAPTYKIILPLLSLCKSHTLDQVLLHRKFAENESFNIYSDTVEIAWNYIENCECVHVWYFIISPTMLS